MAILYIRNARINFYYCCMVDYDLNYYDEFLPLAIKHAIKNGYAIFNDWIFSCWDNLDNNI